METISEGNNRILSDKERDQILHDLFEGKEGTLDSSFLYKGKGAELYEDISKDKSYPFIDIENEAVEELRYNDKFKKILNNTKYITDVGCGDGQKIISLLGSGGPYKDRPFIDWDGTYIPEDYSWPMLDIAVENIKKGLPHVNIGNSQKLNSERHLSQNFSHNMYLFLGGTICNMTDDEIIKELRSMDNNGFLDGNHILLSYFTAPQTQEEIDNLIKIYNSESNRAFHENGMHMLGLSRDDFEFDTVYEKDNPNQTEGPFPGKIKGIIRAKRDCIVKLSSGRTISINQGQEFTIHYSRRFSKSGIEKLFKKSGCNIVFTVDKNGDSIALLRRNPMMLKRFINKNKNSLLLALSVGALGIGTVLGGHISKEKEKQNEKDKALIEWKSDRLVNKDVSSIEGTYYKQETDELVKALQLDQLNENDRNAIIDLFNVYVAHHINKGLTNEQLIQGFWVEYGQVLINNHNLRHSPYDFMNYDVIRTTNNISGEISCTPDYCVGDNIHFKDKYRLDYGIFQSEVETIFEYKDGGDTYLILKINTGKTQIYMAAKDNEKNYFPDFSTNTINKIKDKSGLDQDIINNTNKLGGNFVFANPKAIDRSGRIFLQPSANDARILTINKDNDQIVQLTKLNGGIIKPVGIFINGDLYHVIFVKTMSGKDVGLASKTMNGPYTTTEFNHISQIFSSNRNLGYISAR